MTRSALIALVCLGAAIRAPAVELDDYIAAIVNDHVITYMEVKDTSRNSIGALQQIYMRQPELLTQKATAVLSEAREAIVANVLIVDEFKTSVGVVPEPIIDNEISHRIQREFAGDRQKFRQGLRQQGIRYERYREMVRDDLIRRYMLDRNIRSQIIISPRKIESYYTNHLEDYKMANQIRLRTIVLKDSSAPTIGDVKKLAQELVGKLEAGASFAELASVYSEGSQKAQGGDWGWIDRKYLRKGLSDVAFSLNPGQRSDLIGVAYGPADQYSIFRYDKEGRLVKMLDYGEKAGEKDQLLGEKDLTNDTAAAAAAPQPQEFHLMLMEDKKTAHIKSLAEVKDEIEKNLVIEERQRLHKQWIERLEAKAYVRRF